MNNNETTVNDIIRNTIAPLFLAAGLTLEFFEGTDDWCSSWQYDGGVFGTVIQLVGGTNGTGQPGIFGDYNLANGRSWDLSGTASNWVVDFGQYIPKMAKGEDIF